MPLKIRRIDFSPDEWIAGTLGMTLEEEGLYTRIVARIYSRGEALPADPTELAKICGIRPQCIRRILPKLLPKLHETGGKLTSNRCETELKLARNRLETGRFQGAKGGRPNGLDRLKGKPNHQPSTSKEEGLAPYAANPVFLTHPDGAPPLPSQGDGGAPLGDTTKAPEAPTVFDDPAPKADAVAAFHRCIDAIRGKLGVLDSQATEPPPPDPRLVEFRAWLQRLNALAGERLDGDARWQAWEVLARAEALGDPNAIPPPMLAELAAIDTLAEAAE